MPVDRAASHSHKVFPPARSRKPKGGGGFRATPTKLENNNKEIFNKDNGSDIGPVLNWNPQTGSLQLSQIATQKLLASLGGHVTKRKDTGLTVFFPISDPDYI